MDNCVYAAYATQEQQTVVSMSFEEGKTVRQTIERSGLIEQFPDIDLIKMAIGIFGKLCQLDDIVKINDRVEIYRPLLQSPMDARRNRAVKK